jgi:4-hydroxy-L-threonine phosphate dehydrogenase PdxA
MNELLHYAADIAEFDVFWWRDQFNGRLRYPHDVVVVDYDQYSMLGSAIRAPSKMGGEASMRFCLDAIEAAKPGLVDAVVTAPIAKESWKLAGFIIPDTPNCSPTHRGAAICDDVHRRAAAVVLATVHIPLMGLWGG